MTDLTNITPTTKRPRKMACAPGQKSQVESAHAAGSPPAAKRLSKTALVLDLLARPEGATIAQLVDATGWLPHTTRAALTGLRKKGHNITKGKEGDATCYRVAVEAAA